MHDSEGNQPSAADAVHGNHPAASERVLDSAGVSRETLSQIDAYYRARVIAGRMAGIVYAVARRGTIIHRSAIGFADLDTGREMSLDAVFRLASMTKPITAVALMILHEEGRFDLDDPIARYLPAFGDMSVLRTPMSEPDDVVPADRPITIRHVMQHTAGLGLGLGLGATGEALLLKAGVYRPGDDLAAEMEKVAQVPLCYQPGTVWNYSLAADIQARLVEILSGKDFASFLEERIFTPLGMGDTGFVARPDMLARLAEVHWPNGEGFSPWTGATVPPAPPPIGDWPEPLANLHDPAISYVRGSFGLFSTLDDYLRFALMLAGGGTLDGVRILGESAVTLMSTDSLGPVPMLWPVQGLGFGLGVAVLRDAATAGYTGTPGTFHWDGAFGTVMWIDPARELVVVAMAQHLLIPDLTPDAVGAELRNLVYPALID